MLRLGFNSCPEIVKDFSFECKVFGSLVGSGGVAFFSRHKGAYKRGEFVDPAFVLNLVVTGDLDFEAGGDKCEF